MSERMFPIQSSIGERRRIPAHLITSRIPWSAIAPHEAQAIANHGQDLETLASRGGLDAREAIAVLRDVPWREVAETDVMALQHALLSEVMKAVSREPL
jgi:hypothetical protein